MSVLLEVIQQPPNLKSRIQEIASASSAYRLPCFPSTRRLAAIAAAAIAAHRLPAPLAARAQPAFRAQGSSTEGGGANDARPFLWTVFFDVAVGVTLRYTERPDLLLDITAFQPHQVSAT